MGVIEREEKVTLGDVVVQWWARLDGDRAGRSALRRAATPSEVMLQPIFYDLLRAAKNSSLVVNPLRLAVVAGVIAHVTSHNDSATLGERCAQVFSDGPAGELRFRRILAISTDREELFSAMIRLVRLVKGELNVSDLAEKLYWWNDRARRGLGFDFYSNY